MSLLCTRLHLFDQKYSKNSNTVKYVLVCILICFKMEFIHVMAKLELLYIK